MQNGPVPTTLTLLAELPNFPPGSKVRFMGCVTNYSTKTAILTLQHSHPSASSATALVDVNLLLRTLKSDETQVGAWVNVLGYVERKRQTTSSNEEAAVQIQALLLWSSGPFDLEGYERSVDRRIAEEAPGPDG
ncbi:CST complex subunit Ten1 [Hyaloscypha variabilis]|uniref:CST complex subunit Ten1 n=1 Tax=Hyaloscypha variabilis (strain UAMH 11265 / GT02V1 / F) TaxID=1149755 RepID=A0A2J6S050_HYAVF|nr:hypothetical protein L207DRAFT_525499 [Hyaloscypha variabilis F]